VERTDGESGTVSYPPTDPADGRWVHDSDDAGDLMIMGGESSDWESMPDSGAPGHAGSCGVRPPDDGRRPASRVRIDVTEPSVTTGGYSSGAGRSTSRESTSVVRVRKTNRSVRIRSTASSRCAVSRARTISRASASPVTV
jgi:hypothetical protein